MARWFAGVPNGGLRAESRVFVCVPNEGCLGVFVWAGERSGRCVVGLRVVGKGRSDGLELAGWCVGWRAHHNITAASCAAATNAVTRSTSPLAVSVTSKACQSKSGFEGMARHDVV